MAFDLPWLSTQAAEVLLALFNRRKETTHMNWKGLASAAATAVLACGSAAFATNTDQSRVSSASALMTPNYLDDTTTAPAATEATTAASAPSETTLTPLMFLLDPTPVGQWLEKYKFNITGFVEVGYFVDTNNPKIGSGPGNTPLTTIFYPGAYSNRVVLDQLDLTISKSVDTTKSFDFGFLFENGYGVDDQYTHSNGMLDNRAISNPRAALPGHPNNQYDILQLNGTVLLPVGTGLQITAGKFVGFLGQEVINPTGNLFYTHSYSFDYGVAATVTGAYATYTFGKLLNGNDWTFKLGGTNGWNQSLRDNNGSIDFLGEASGSITSKLALVVNAQVGPEGTNDNHNWWGDFEFIPTYTVSDQLTLVGDFLYGFAPHSAIVPGANSAQWYGAVLYGNYKLTPMFAINLRTEWYREQGGMQFGTGNLFSANYYEATAGVQIHPLPNDNILQYLQFRPELRVDWSDRPAYNPAHNGGAGDYSQLTFAVDAIMQF
jgi:hypothetical protein